MTARVKILNGHPLISEYSYAISVHQSIETWEYTFLSLGNINLINSFKIFEDGSLEDKGDKANAIRREQERADLL